MNRRKLGVRNVVVTVAAAVLLLAAPRRHGVLRQLRAHAHVDPRAGGVVDRVPVQLRRDGVVRPVPASSASPASRSATASPSRARVSSSACNPWLAVVFALAITSAGGVRPRGAGQPDDRHLLPDADADLRRDRLLRVRPGHVDLRLRRDHRRQPARRSSTRTPCACTTPCSSCPARLCRLPRVCAAPRSGWRSKGSATTPVRMARSGSTCRSTAPWRSPSPGSSPAWPA